MKKNQLFGTFFLSALLLILVTSCQKESRYEPVEESITSAASSGTNIAETNLLGSVKDATAKFHSTNQAIKEGYEADEHCVSVPGLGGMGYHWVNFSLVDPVLDPLKPEAVLYAAGKNGKLQLIALEYIVINVGQPRPMFGDHPMDIGGAPIPVPHWTLHVWLYESNPNGMFTPFNPNVSCQ